MSVVKSKRSEGTLSVLTKSNELAVYTIRICSNEKNFPKRYRWCLTSKLVEYAVDIANFITMANAIYVTDDNDYAIRKAYQTKALSASYALLNMIDMSYRTFGIETDRVEYWTRLLMDVQTLLRNWRKRDIERYEDKG